MKKNFFIFIISSIIILLFLCFFCFDKVSASELTDNVKSQIDNLDLDELQNFFNEIEKDGNIDFYTLFDNLINGNYEFSYDSIFSYVNSIIFPQFKKLAPLFMTIIAVSLFCAIMNSVKSNFFNEGIGEVIFFICYGVVACILISQFVSLYNSTKNVIENIAKLSDIMSPIILTLMIASGGTVSASVYKPAVLFLSQGVINIILSVILSLTFIITILNVLSNVSNSIRLKKYADFFNGIVKWVIGIIVTIFGIFMTVQGITSATFDGISVKAAKYAISNSIPLIGGFLKDGFDIVVAGSVLIKNSLGIVSVFALFYMLIAPVACFFAVSILLKLTAAITDSFADQRISELCSSISKSVNLLLVALLIVAFCFFITALLFILSANAFI